MNPLKILGIAVAIATGVSLKHVSFLYQRVTIERVNHTEYAMKGLLQCKAQSGG